MLSIPITRILAAGAVGLASAGLVARSAGGHGTADRFRPLESLGKYEARVTGATSATVRGTVEVGNPAGNEVPGTFVIALGAASEDGALILTRRQAGWPEPGTYPVSEEPTAQGFTALVIPGSPARPLGLFRAERGTLTITSRSPDAITGKFELQARGFVTGEPQREDRSVAVEGSFLGIVPVPGVVLR